MVNRVNPIWHGVKSNLFDMGGAIWPPHQKKSGTCPLVMKLGGIVGLGLNFTMIPNLSHPRSLWRHSDVTMVMTSSKSVKIGYRHNFWTNYSLIMIDPSFFMFWVALLNEIHVDDYSSRADVSSFYLPDFRLRHYDVTWRHHVGCRIFLSEIIFLIDI